MKTVRTALFFVLAFLALPAWAQDSPAYVSRLTAQAGPQSILLTWKDAEGYPNVKYEIWRSDKEIVKDSLSQAKLVGLVAPGVEAFEDTTVTSPSYYLVLLRDAAGNRKGFYIPFRNKTTSAIVPDGATAEATARIRVGTVSYAAPLVLIPFQAFPPDRKLIVFRRASPITDLEDLKDATPLGNTTGAQSPWKDKADPGLEFYYAVLDLQAFTDGREDAFQPANATDAPAGFPLVTIPDSVQTTGLDAALRPGIDASTRALPLPRLQVSSEPDSGNTMVAPAFEPITTAVLPEKTSSVLRLWAKGTAKRGLDLPAPVVLPEERTASQTGAGRYLVQIQKAYLEVKDWSGAVGALETVLKLSLPPRTEARARFYRGVAYAYQKEYKKAFVEILAARQDYPAETTPFLEALFSLLAEAPE